MNQLLRNFLIRNLPYDGVNTKIFRFTISFLMSYQKRSFDFKTKYLTMTLKLNISGQLFIAAASSETASIYSCCQFRNALLKANMSMSIIS